LRDHTGGFDLPYAALPVKLTAAVQNQREIYCVELAAHPSGLACDKPDSFQRKQGTKRIFMSGPVIDRKRQVSEMKIHGEGAVILSKRYQEI
jgi:hypothetical protein